MEQRHVPARGEGGKKVAQSPGALRKVHLGGGGANGRTRGPARASEARARRRRRRRPTPGRCVRGGCRPLARCHARPPGASGAPAGVGVWVGWGVGVSRNGAFRPVPVPWEEPLPAATAPCQGPWVCVSAGACSTSTDLCHLQIRDVYGAEGLLFKSLREFFFQGKQRPGLKTESWTVAELERQQRQGAPRGGGGNCASTRVCA